MKLNTSTLSKIHYIMLSFVVLMLGSFFSKGPAITPIYIWHVSFLNNLDLNPNILYPLIFSITYISIILNILYEKKALKIFTFIFMITLFSLRYSFGHISHPNHIWIWSSLFFIFIDPKKEITSRSNIKTFQFLIATHFLIYFNAGIWKLRSLIRNNDFSLVSIKDSSLESIGVSLAHGLKINPAILDFFINYQDIAGIGFFFIIAFQLSTILPLIKYELAPKFFILSIFFHLITGIFTGHWYMQTAFMCFYLYFLTSTLFNKKTIITFT